MNIIDEMIKAVAAELLAHGEFGSTEESNRANATAAAKAVLQIALSASPATVAAGDWVMVPRAATAEMVDAWEDAYRNAPEGSGHVWAWEDAYRSMIAAASTPPAPAQPAAEPVTYTSQAQLSHAAKSPAGYLITWRKPIPYHEDIPLYLAAPVHVAAEAQLAALEEASNALRPLSDAVYNDNGDMTVSVPIVSAEECIIAYLAVKRIRSALASETEGGRHE